ncbi:MAG: hypothetical protein FIB01_10505 [Gemmatimonadetes bacterium]|nr:hypothetical protein [Gemmatimonadota bacterium]
MGRMPTNVRILLLADTHLGFDLPVRPRGARRRRGHDFLANYAAALQPALDGEVDIVVHGGDVFDRPRVPATLARQAYEPLARIAARGIPVFLVPGNHERSRLPHAGLAAHPGTYVFDRPRTFVVEVRGVRVALSGFPFHRRAVRSCFQELLACSGWLNESAAFRLLCMHQCVEGATVGAQQFMFRNGADVVRIRDIPSRFTAVLSGHIHRQQVLRTDLQGRPSETPVLYPGSIERTSLAEIGEPKGFMVVHLTAGGTGASARWDLRPLSARPMVKKELRVAGQSAALLHRAVSEVISAVPADAVLRIRLVGVLTDAHLRAISAPCLRAIAPPGMNVDVRAGNWPFPRRLSAPATGPHASASPSRTFPLAQLDLAMPA